MKVSPQTIKYVAIGAGAVFIAFVAYKVAKGIGDGATGLGGAISQTGSQAGEGLKDGIQVSTEMAALALLLVFL